MPKYIITRSDGRPVPPEARFFLLRVDEHGKPETRVARAAVSQYAKDVYDIDREACRAAERVLMGLPDQINYAEDGR